ncbi:hypothetical protein GCM10025776_15780 [Corallincola platygyrae]
MQVSEVSALSPIQIDLLVAWEAHRGAKPDLLADTLQIQLGVDMENEESTQYETSLYDLQLDQPGQFIIAIDGVEYDLYDYVTEVDEGMIPAFLPDVSGTMYTLVLETTTVQEKLLEVMLQINGADYYASAVIPEHVQISYDESIVNAYDSLADDLHIDWTSGSPLNDLRMVPVLTEEESCASEQVRSVEEEFDIANGSYSILAGSLGECSTQQNQLYLAGHAVLDINSDDFSDVYSRWGQHLSLYLEKAP